MSFTSAPLFTRVAQIIAPATLALSLAACTPAATLTTTNAAAPISESTPATTSATAATTSAATPTTGTTATATRRVVPGAGGPGTLTLALTAPKQVSGHVDTAVTCVPGRVYRAYGNGAVQGYTVRVTASAAGYTGPGTYPTTLTGSIVAPGGEAFALAGVRTSASISTTGGSAPFQATGSRGRTLAGSVGWACWSESVHASPAPAGTSVSSSAGRASLPTRIMTMDVTSAAASSPAPQ